MEILGDSVEKIAAEKAGILKSEVPLVFIESSAESDAVIEKCAQARNIFCKKIEKMRSKFLEPRRNILPFHV